jgi:hypothetical protein
MSEQFVGRVDARQSSLSNTEQYPGLGAVIVQVGLKSA